MVTCINIKLQCTSIQCAVYRFTVGSVQVYTAQYTVHMVQCTVQSVLVYSAKCTGVQQYSAHDTVNSVQLHRVQL